MQARKATQALKEALVEGEEARQVMDEALSKEREMEKR